MDRQRGFVEGGQMTDNLVERLREKAFRTETYELLEDAADRIEKLEAVLDEAAFSQTLFDAVVGQRNKATDRIEQLEAALREIVGALNDPKGGQHVYDMRNASYIARKALEGKDE